MIVAISLTIYGIIFYKNEPKVEPSKLQGIVTNIISKSILEVFLNGCFLNITLSTLGNAEPATIG